MESSSTNDLVFRVRPKVPWQEIDGQVVVVDSINQRAHEFCEVSSEIWKSMHSNPARAQELAIGLTESFLIDIESARSDVADILDVMLKENLVEVVEE